MAVEREGLPEDFISIPETPFLKRRVRDDIPFTVLKDITEESLMSGPCHSKQSQLFLK